MKTQVLVAAQNEARRIESLMIRLPRDEFDVTVVVNGSNDDTAEIASRYASVYERDEPGKLPALQEGLRRLGSNALNELLIIDADTVPLRPRLWKHLMSTALRPDLPIPTVSSGPVIYTPNGSGYINPVFRSVFRYAETVKTVESASSEPIKGKQFGPNMGIHLATKSALDAVLDLPHIWPAEDVAVAMEVVESHPNARFNQVVHPGVTALTPRPEPMQPILSYFINADKASEAERVAYTKSRPTTDAVSFDEWLGCR